MNTSGLDSIDRPESIEQLCDSVRQSSNVLPVGNGTKSPLSMRDDVTRVSLTGLSGITQYEPSEFTFTAMAGTTVGEIKDALAEKGQYLPSDLMMVGAGATLGGSVAAGLSGSGRMRYGSLRDFILGVRFVGGGGELFTAGAKVVKNVAGFDFAKLMTGSCGQFGALVEITFKVFPLPQATRTVLIDAPKASDALRIMAKLARSRLELDAIDYSVGDQTVVTRLAGPEASLAALQKSLEVLVESSCDVMDSDHASEHWSDVCHFENFSADVCVAKVPCATAQCESICSAIAKMHNAQLYFTGASTCAFIGVSQDRIDALSDCIDALGLSGLMMRGRCRQRLIGTRIDQPIAARIKLAIDPTLTFAGL